MSNLEDAATRHGPSATGNPSASRRLYESPVTAGLPAPHRTSVPAACLHAHMQLHGRLVGSMQDLQAAGSRTLVHGIRLHVASTDRATAVAKTVCVQGVNTVFSCYVYSAKVPRVPRRPAAELSRT